MQSNIRLCTSTALVVFDHGISGRPHAANDSSLGRAKKTRQQLFAVAEKIFKANSRLNRPAADHYKVMIKVQARVLELNEKLALEGLAQLLPTQKDRIEAFAIAKQIACAE